MTTQTRNRVVILGAGYGGLMTAARLAQRRPALDITVIDSRDHFVERIRLHQLAAGQPVPARPMASLLPRGVQFRQARVVGLDPAGRTVTLDAPGALGERETVEYDWLVYALGSGVAMTGAPGVAEHALGLNGPQAAERLGATLRRLAATGGRLLVVGGGLTGIEAASELAAAFPSVRVTLLTEGRLGADLSPAGAAHLRRVFDRLGVAVVEGERVTRVEAGVAHLASGQRVEFDACVWAAGFSVAPLAAEARLPVNERGQVLTTPTLQVVGHERILAVGDAAQAWGVDGWPLRMACAVALPMGAHAAESISRLAAGRSAAPFRFGYVIRCISLGRRDGLVQAVGLDDRPLPRVLTGRVAALVKEAICRLTVLTIQGERRLGVPVFAWPRPRGTADLVQPQADEVLA